MPNQLSLEASATALNALHTAAMTKDLIGSNPDDIDAAINLVVAAIAAEYQPESGPRIGG